MVSPSLVYYMFTFVGLFLVVRLLSKTNVVLILVRSWQSFVDRFHVYQLYKVPQYNEHFQENQLYRKISTYLNSLPSVEDTDYTNLFSGSKSNDIFFHLDASQSIRDTFLSATVYWTNQRSEPDGVRSFVLRIKKSDKRRVFRQYFQHILAVSDEIEQRKKEIKLHILGGGGGNERWRSIPFTHPANFDTVIIDADLKSKIKSDLELFLKSKQYYHRLGRVWKRSYLLYGPSGTGKTSFVAAMARLLCYDVYDLDVARVSNDYDLKMLLLQTTPKSLIVVEDLDRFLIGQFSSSAVSFSGLLNFMDGIISSCGEERVLVFTVNGKDQIDQAVMRPGRIDVHMSFPLCDFSAFKSLASNYLGLKEHKLFPQVEEIFQTGASLSPAEIGEIMISNRTSPSRALKSVISALQTEGRGGGGGISKLPPRLSKSGSDRSGDESGEPGTTFCRESVHTVRELRKLYGLFRLGSRRKEEAFVDLVGPSDKEGSRHEGQPT